MELTLDPRAVRLLRRLPLPRRFPYAFVEATLIVLLAVQAARIMWAAFGPLGPVGAWTAAPPVVLGNGAGLLRTFDPFFRLSGQTGATVVTSLPVKLFGVRVDQAMGRSSAIIATPDGLQTSYAVGDEIMPGIVLKAVAKDSVTIDRGGAAEQLFLDQSVPAQVAQPTGATLPPPPGAPAASAAVAPTAAALRSGVGFAPRLENGAVTGFVVTPKGSGEVFRAAGFQPGDVLTQINGMGFRSVEDAADAVANLPANGVVTFVVERAGKTVTLSARAGQ